MLDSGTIAKALEATKPREGWNRKTLKLCDTRPEAGFSPVLPSQNIGAKRIRFATRFAPASLKWYFSRGWAKIPIFKKNAVASEEIFCFRTPAQK